MAIKTQAQIQVESNVTYIDNAVGSITPANVRAFNTNWVDSTIYVEQTGSMQVASASLATTASFATNAATASLLLGSVVSSSYAYTASSAVNATNALTASFIIGTIASASLAQNSLLLQGTGSNGFATTASLTTVSSSLQAVSASNQQLSASYIALSASYNVFSGSASTRLTNTSQSLQAVSASDQQTSASYIALSGSYNIFSGSASTRITSLESFSSSLNNTFATDAELNAATQSLSASTSTVNTRVTEVSSSLLQVSASYIALSGSYNTFSGSASTRITANSSSIQSVSASTQQVSASYIALSGSYNIFSGSASTRITSLESFSSSLSTTFATDAELNAATQSLSASISTVNSSLTVVSASLQAVSSSTQQVSASYIALSASYNVFSGSASTRITNNSASISALNTATGSFAVLSANQTFSGKNTFNNDITASNVRITGTASIAFLDVQFQSSSVIYSSGSNQFGDASNDTQTLWGTVNVISGPLVVTGSANFKETITGSISGNAGTATSSTSASYAFTASSAVNAASSISASYAYTASSAVNATSASFATTASFALNAGSDFPFTGSAQITGSLGVTGSVNVSDTINTDIIKVATNIQVNNIYDSSGGTINLYPSAQTILRTKTNVEGILLVDASTQFTGSVLMSGSLTVTGSANFKEIITGSITGNAATATSASYALSASFLIGGASSAITIADEGASQGTATFLNFVGAGVTATVSSNTASINIAGGGGSAFPFSGSAEITGSLGVTGSFSIASGSILLLANTALNNRGISAMVTQSAASRNNIIAVTFGSANSTGSFVISGSNNYISLANPVANSSFNQGAAFGANLTNSILTVLPLVTGSNGAANARPLPGISNSSVNARITINDRRAIQSTQALLTVATSAILASFTFSSNTGSYLIQDQIMSAASTVIDYTGSVVSGIPAAGSYGNAIFGTSHNIKQVVSGSADLTYSLISGQSNRLLISGSGPDNNLNAVGVIGNFLIITGSSGGGGSDSGTLLVGRFNNPIGNLGDSLQTVVAVGTGTSQATRRTSLHVSSSGLTTIFDGLRVSGSQVITGSLYGAPVSQSVASSTASLNLQAGNFFNLTLPASANTYITASGQLPGQTINLKITQQATTGSISLGAGIKQVSGSAYTVTAVASAVDIVTFISFDETGLYLSNVKNLV